MSTFICNQCNEEKPAEEAALAAYDGTTDTNFMVCNMCHKPASFQDAVNWGQRALGNPDWFLADGTINPQHPDYQP